MGMLLGCKKLLADQDVNMHAMPIWAHNSLCFVSWLQFPLSAYYPLVKKEKINKNKLQFPGGSFKSMHQMQHMQN